MEAALSRARRSDAASVVARAVGGVCGMILCTGQEPSVSSQVEGRHRGKAVERKGAVEVRLSARNPRRRKVGDVGGQGGYCFGGNLRSRRHDRKHVSNRTEDEQQQQETDDGEENTRRWRQQRDRECCLLGWVESRQVEINRGCRCCLGEESVGFGGFYWWYLGGSGGRPVSPGIFQHAAHFRINSRGFGWLRKARRSTSLHVQIHPPAPNNLLGLTLDGCYTSQALNPLSTDAGCVQDRICLAGLLPPSHRLAPPELDGERKWEGEGRSRNEHAATQHQRDSEGCCRAPAARSRQEKAKRPATSTAKTPARSGTAAGPGG